MLVREDLAVSCAHKINAEITIHEPQILHLILLNELLFDFINSLLATAKDQKIVKIEHENCYDVTLS